MTGVAILGSTGSIGRQALEVIAGLPDELEVRALAAGHVSDTFSAQLSAWPSAAAWAAGGRPSGVDPGRWVDGGLPELATRDGVEIVLVATTGMTALPAVLAALQSGRRVALANKETLVTGGHLVERALDAIDEAIHDSGAARPTVVEGTAADGAAARRLDRLRPVDSEHSAIWQCLLGERIGDVRRLVLTASGGPFRGRDQRSLEAVSPTEALNHPTWRMGPKVTVDSATLVNKAFEVIEAKWLYRLPYSKIAEVIHPQSVVHSFVEFRDGSYKAQLGLPDMRLPIQYALTAPRRMPAPGSHAGPDAWPTLTFARLERGAYPAHDAVIDAARRGGNRGAVVNAADEIAVAAFLDGRLAFTRIGGVLEAAVVRWESDVEPSLDEIGTLDAEVRAALGRELGGTGS